MNNLNDKPLVSVYVTTKDRPDYLKRALESLSSQTYKHIQVLVCNDGSKISYEEAYNELVQKYTNCFESFVYVCNVVSLGACLSRNKLLSLAKGKFVTGLDDDDFFFPKRIELFIKNYNENYAFLCAKGSLNIKDQYNREADGGEVITFEQLKNCNLVGNQIFVEKKRLLEISGFDKNMPAWQDYDTWFRLLEKYDRCYKLNARTMFIDTNILRERISTTSKAHYGYRAFIEKHASKLSKYNLLSLKYNDLINRKEKFPIFTKDLISNPKLLIRVFKERSVYYYPSLYSFYRKFLS